MPDSDIEQLKAEVESLRDVVKNLEARIQGATAGTGEALAGVRSRRDLLRMAGTGMIGAAGALALRAVPAAAANGGTMTLGQANNADALTSLNYTDGSPTTTILLEAAQATSVPGNPTTQQGLNGAIFGLGASGKDGLDGYAPGGTGYGVLGQSDAGYGVVGATDTGVDVAALGTGRLQQRSSGPGQPGWTPAAGRFEIVRDDNGFVWASGAAGAWHRHSAIVTFASPQRVFDGFATPVTSGNTYGPINATQLAAGGSSGVPAGASAIYAAVQCLNHPAPGRLTIYPDLAADPNIANWACEVGGNPSVLSMLYMLVPLSSAGKFKIHAYITGNVFVDAWGYVI